MFKKMEKQIKKVDQSFLNLIWTNSTYKLPQNNIKKINK